MVQQWWMTWGSGQYASAAYICPLSLLMPNPEVLLVFYTDCYWACWLEELVGWTLPSSWWVDLPTWFLVRCSVSIRASGMLGAIFQMVHSSPLQMAWSCSRTLEIYLVSLLLQCAISSTWYVFPPQIIVISIGSSQSFGPSSVVLHCILDLFKADSLSCYLINRSESYH